MHGDFAAIKGFDYANAIVHLWIFKKSTTARKFNAWFVRTDQGLRDLLRGLIVQELSRVTETSPYGYLSQPNENSCLTDTLNGCDFSLLKLQVDRPEPECAIDSLEALKGAEGYVVKFVSGAHTVYAVKKATATWKTSYPKRFINMVFNNGELVAAPDNGFAIERNFDFYCSGQTIFVTNKRAYESSMGHTVAYARAFAGMSASREFQSLFTDVQPLINYVGTNSIQLRRMAVVEQKRLYVKPNFLPSLKRVSAKYGWGLNFDVATQRLIPCDQTARTILQVLLDHRLISEVTANVYDVPDATPV